MNSHLVLKNHVKEYRLSYGISQSVLAQNINTTRNTICAIENGKFCPSAYLAALLCAFFVCKFEDLFFLDLDEF